MATLVVAHSLPRLSAFLSQWPLASLSVGCTSTLDKAKISRCEGKEGPFVHIASCVGNIVSRYVPHTSPTPHDRCLTHWRR